MIYTVAKSGVPTAELTNSNVAGADSVNIAELNAKVKRTQMELDKYFHNAHPSPLVALKFSGGKDSLACLELVRPWLDRVFVVWANAGDEYPETMALMQKISREVPNFFEVRGNASLTQRIQGYPVDMLTQGSTPLGMHMELNHKHPKLMLRSDCCLENFWQPLQNAIYKMGIKQVISGQRKTERMRNTGITNGTILNGLFYCLPIENWTHKDVMGYLKLQGVEIPRQYEYGGMSSLDCMLCTAYLYESKDKLRYLRDHHPAHAVEFERRLKVIQDEQQLEARRLQAVLDVNSAQTPEMWAD